MPTEAIHSNLAYVLTIGGVDPFYFNQVSGLGTQAAVIEQQRVDSSGKIVHQKIPGSHSFLDLVLSHHVNANPALWAWRAQVEAGDAGGYGPSNADRYRRNAILTAVDFSQQVIRRWTLVNAWPRKLTIELNEAGALPLEVLTLTYDSIS